MLRLQHIETYFPTLSLCIYKITLKACTIWVKLPTRPISKAVILPSVIMSTKLYSVNLSKLPEHQTLSILETVNNPRFFPSWSDLRSNCEKDSELHKGQDIIYIVEKLLRECGWDQWQLFNFHNLMCPLTHEHCYRPEHMERKPIPDFLQSRTTHILFTDRPKVWGGRTEWTQSFLKLVKQAHHPSSHSPFVNFRRSGERYNCLHESKSYLESFVNRSKSLR